MGATLARLPLQPGIGPRPRLVGEGHPQLQQMEAEAQVAGPEVPAVVSAAGLGPLGRQALVVGALLQRRGQVLGRAADHCDHGERNLPAVGWPTSCQAAVKTLIVGWRGRETHSSSRPSTFNSSSPPAAETSA